MSKSDFLKRFTPSASGSPTAPKYRAVVKRDGDIELIPDGVRYLDLEIQSYRDSCDPNVIIARFTSGDISSLPNAGYGVYTDLTEIPTSKQAVLQQVIDAQKAFENLPSDARQKYDNDWMKFYVAFEDASSAPIKDDVKESE